MKGSSATTTGPASVVLDPLGLVDLLRTACCFLSLGLISGTYIQYAGELVKYGRTANPSVEPPRVEDFLRLPFLVGTFCAPVFGLALDWIDVKKALCGSGLAVVAGLFALGQFPFFPAALFLLAALSCQRLAAYTLLATNCHGNGWDRYGRAFCGAGALEILGIYVALQVTNLSWATHYAAGARCRGICVDFKFAFHLVLPVITVLCTSLSALARTPTIRHRTQPLENSARGAAGDTPMIRVPRSGSGARLCYVVAFASSCCWACLFFHGSLFISKELFLVYNVFREDVRTMGSPMLDAPLPLDDPAKESYALASSLSSFFLAAAGMTCVVLFLSKYVDGHYLMSRLYCDVGSNLLCANLLLPFLFVSYPLRSLLYVWSLALGVAFALHLVLPGLIVTRYIVPNPTALFRCSAHKYLAGLLFTQNVGFLFSSFLGSYFYSNIYQSFSGVFVLFAAILLCINALVVKTLAAKEQEITRVKMGLEGASEVDDAPGGRLAQTRGGPE